MTTARLLAAIALVMSGCGDERRTTRVPTTITAPDAAVAIAPPAPDAAIDPPPPTVKTADDWRIEIEQLADCPLSEWGYAEPSCPAYASLDERWESLDDELRRDLIFELAPTALRHSTLQVRAWAASELLYGKNLGGIDPEREAAALAALADSDAGARSAMADVIAGHSDPTAALRAATVALLDADPDDRVRAAACQMLVRGDAADVRRGLKLAAAKGTPTLVADACLAGALRRIQDEVVDQKLWLAALKQLEKTEPRPGLPSAHTIDTLRGAIVEWVPTKRIVKLARSLVVDRRADGEARKAALVVLLDHSDGESGAEALIDKLRKSEPDFAEELHEVYVRWVRENDA